MLGGLAHYNLDDDREMRYIAELFSLKNDDWEDERREEDLIESFLKLSKW